MVYDPAKQKHHYVPKFFFRLFEEKGHVEVYDIVEKKFHPGNCKDLSFIRNFYENPAIEKEFSNIDKASSDPLWKLVNDKSFSILTIAEKVNIFRFLVFQHMRTPKAKEKYEKFFKFITNELIRDLFRKNIGKKPFITKEWVETGVMPTIEGPIFMTILLNILIEGHFHIADLVPVILINNTDKDFIFSDDPVIFYNSFFNYVDDLDMTYSFSPGLQIFSPLDSKTMLMLYDPKFYNAKGISVFNDVQGLPTSVINIIQGSDIDALNSLQFLNCEKSIYFIDKNQSTYIKGLHSSLDADAKPKTYGSSTYAFEDKTPELSKELSEFYIKGNVGYQLHLSFMSFVPCPGATETMGEGGFPIRSTELMLIIKMVTKQIRNKYNIKI